MYVMRRKDCWVRFNPNNPRQQYIICKPKMKETFEEILDKMDIQARRAQNPITTTLRARDEFSRGPDPNVRGGGLFPPPEETPGGPAEDIDRGEDPFSLLQFTKDRLKEEEEFMKPDPKFGGIPAPKDYLYPGEIELGRPPEYSNLRFLQQRIEQRLRDLEKEGHDTDDLYEEYFGILGNNSIKEIINNNLLGDFYNKISLQHPKSAFYKEPTKEPPPPPTPTLKSETKKWKGIIKELKEGKKLSEEDKKKELETLNEDFTWLWRPWDRRMRSTKPPLPPKGTAERDVYEDFKKELKKL